MIEIATQLSQPCQLPFKVDGKIFRSCAVEKLGNEEIRWCSTAVDNQSREHISGLGFWGVCHKTKCFPKPLDTKPISCKYD